MRTPTRLIAVLTVLACLVAASSIAAAQEVSELQAVEAMRRAVTFFRENASAGGGYIYRLSADLSEREGEVAVDDATAWIQPPGTPHIGMAYLQAYRLTDEPFLLDAAIETGTALVNGQLASGGWSNEICFNPETRKKISYRVDGGTPGKGTMTTFDDDKSQSALRFLMQFDRELEGEHEQIAEAVRYAQVAFLKAQYPNGAWPQRYREFPDPEVYPVLKASYPDQWSRTYPGADYTEYYTLNDQTISDLIDTMLDAYDLYGDERFLAAALRGGDFFLLAQMPDPQPGWCQQYNRKMQPAWARKFEPPAITGSESQAAMQTLLDLYRRTGEQKYLEPIPRALAYYKKSVLPNGQLARFYELKTNRPLYFTKDYQLTYSDADMPTHYAFKVGSRLDRIEREYEAALELSPEQVRQRQQRRQRTEAPRLTTSLQNRAADVIGDLDERGAWVEEGRMRESQHEGTTQVIESRTFADNLLVLANYVAAARAPSR